MKGNYVGFSARDKRRRRQPCRHQSWRQIFGRYIRILQDLTRQTDAEHFTGMNRHDSATTIRMAKKIVAAFDSNHFEPHLAQYSHHFSARKPGFSRHGSNSNALHADEFGGLREFLLNLQAELNRLASTLQQDIE